MLRTESVEDLEDVLTKATVFCERYGTEGITAEIADARDFVREELMEE